MYTIKTQLFTLVSVMLLAACGGKTDDAAQPSEEDTSVDNPYAAYAGDWMTEAYAIDGAEPLVVVLVKATDDSEGWTWKFTHIDDPVATNNVFMKGDSVVTEVGPYVSALREGQSVTVTSYLHAHGDSLSGRFVAEYENGDELRGRLQGERL